MKCQPPCVHPDDIIGALDIRNMASGRRQTPISRHTLAAWRADSFPKPIRVLEGAGPGGADVELFDRRQVLAWLKERR